MNTHHTHTYMQNSKRLQINYKTTNSYQGISVGNNTIQIYNGTIILISLCKVARIILNDMAR